MNKKLKKQVLGFFEEFQLDVDKINEGKKHIKWYASTPNGGKLVVTTSSTPSDIRAAHKMKSDIFHEALKCGWDGKAKTIVEV